MNSVPTSQKERKTHWLMLFMEIIVINTENMKYINTKCEKMQSSSETESKQQT
jgi:hypothetical protein